MADRENEMSREADHRGVRLVAALAVAAALTAPASATARAGQTLLEQQSWPIQPTLESFFLLNTSTRLKSHPS